MKDKEKQIKLLTKRISKIQNKGVKDIPNFTNIFIDNQELAEELVEMGYQRIKKDDIVISKEEYKYLKSIEKSYDPFWFCAFGGCEGARKECKDTCEMSIFVKERKETAKKYHKAMRKVIHERDYIEGYAEIGLQEENDEIAKQLGVEIKED